MQWFAGQYMVRHHLDVVKRAAEHRIAINTHEPVKDTGLRRTWPNWVSREGARGQEFNAWGNPTNPPEPDRKSVVVGKSVSVRVDLGGRRIIKTTNILT